MTLLTSALEVLGAVVTILIFSLNLSAPSTPSSFSPPRPILLDPHFDPLSLWQLPRPDINNDTAGYRVAPSITTLPVFIATNSTPNSYGTYSHHPHILVVNQSLLISFSNGMVDEDADGQQVLWRVSHDGGSTFQSTLPLFPPALRPGESPSLWKSDTLQRAMCSEGFKEFRDGRIFAFAELYGQSLVSIPGEAQGWKATGFGRVAREVDPHWPSILGPLCWVQPSRYAAALNGTPYDLRTTPTCEDTEELLAVLSYGGMQPAWSWSLMSDNHPVLAAAGQGSVGGVNIAEPTKAFPFTSSPHTLCRFWRSLAPPPNRTEFIECAQANSSEYNRWYNGTDEVAKGAYGPYASILRTDIPDVGSKSVFLALPPSSSSSSSLTHIYVSNPSPRPSGDRLPLTIATSADNSTWTAIYALHASAPARARYAGRYKNYGYQYPSVAVQQSVDGKTEDGYLHLVYSLNKEDIYLSSLRLTDLPIAPTDVALHHTH